MYSPRRIAQMAAFFAQRHGGVISMSRLSRLLYLSDRESLARYGRPITYDRPVSMPHGPVLARTLDLMAGFTGGVPAAQWDEWMIAGANHDVAVKRKFCRTDLDEISNADLDVLESIRHTFGGMDPQALRNWTREYCTEWTDPDGSVTPIDDAAWLRSVGTPDKRVQTLADEIQGEREIDRLFVRQK